MFSGYPIWDPKRVAENQVNLRNLSESGMSDRSRHGNVKCSIYKWRKVPRLPVTIFVSNWVVFIPKENTNTLIHPQQNITKPEDNRNDKNWRSQVTSPDLDWGWDHVRFCFLHYYRNSQWHWCCNSHHGLHDRCGALPPCCYGGQEGP